jgi:hypothetical protein
MMENTKNYEENFINIEIQTLKNLEKMIKLLKTKFDLNSCEKIY